MRPHPTKERRWQCRMSHVLVGTPRAAQLVKDELELSVDTQSSQLTLQGLFQVPTCTHMHMNTSTD